MIKSEEKGIDTLKVWQKAMSYAIHIQKQILPLFPPEERWVLTMQLRRSAQSIPANIAEGYGRYYYQEGIRFCYVARGSLEETYTHLAMAHELGYISKSSFNELIADNQELHRLLNGYISFLKKSKRGEHEPGSTHQINDTSSYVSTVDLENEDLDSSLPKRLIT